MLATSRVEPRTWVAIREERADGEEHLGDGQRGAPVVLEYVQADDALAVDVAVVDARAEGHLGRLEGVLRREVQVQEEHAALVHRPGRPQDRRHPLVNVVALGPGTGGGGGGKGGKSFQWGNDTILQLLI